MPRPVRHKNTWTGRSRWPVTCCPETSPPASFAPIRWFRDPDAGGPAGAGCDDAERGPHVWLLPGRMLPL